MLGWPPMTKQKYFQACFLTYLAQWFLMTLLCDCESRITDWQQQYCNYHWCNLGTLESSQSWWWWDTVTWSQKITLHPVLSANNSNIIKSKLNVDTETMLHQHTQEFHVYFPIFFRDGEQNWDKQCCTHWMNCLGPKEWEVVRDLFCTLVLCSPIVLSSVDEYE